MRFFVYGPHPTNPSLRGPLVPVSIEMAVALGLREGQQVDRETMERILAEEEACAEKEDEPPPRRKTAHPSWHVPLKRITKSGGVDGGAY